jgi:predicted nucleic acid-binding protein
MPDRRFFDTNILVYALAADDPRSGPAETLVASGGVIGIQVLNELTSVMRCKLRWPWDQVDEALSVIKELLGPPRPLTAAIHARAVALARQHTLSFYDALIVAAALEANCQLLCSEDMQHGRKFGALTIENPFHH